VNPVGCSTASSPLAVATVKRWPLYTVKKGGKVASKGPQ
jgi:hypothetical protein